MSGAPAPRISRSRYVGSVLALLIFAITYTVFIPVAGCPFCPYVSPQSPGKPGCPECDDTKRVSIYQRWVIQRRLKDFGR